MVSANTCDGPACYHDSCSTETQQRLLFCIHHSLLTTHSIAMLTTLLSQSTSGLPEGWEVRHSNSKNLPYYFSPATKESRWDPPSGTDTDKLKSYMATHHSSGIAPTSSAKTEGKIRAAHLLVKHRESRRPSSWREEKITRTKDEAIGILHGHEEKIRGGQTTLADLAMKESDCSSARKGGDLWGPDTK